MPYCVHLPCGPSEMKRFKIDSWDKEVWVRNKMQDGVPSPGQKVRVTRAGASERALLLCVHGESAQAEVEMFDGTEALVPLVSLLPLESFELGPVDAAGLDAVAFADRCKARGNMLFKLRDLAAALEFYLMGSRALRDDAPLAEGSRCVVVPAGNGRPQSLRSAMVLTRQGDRCEVLYEPPSPPVARPVRVAKSGAAGPSAGDCQPAAGGGWLSWLTSSNQSSAPAQATGCSTSSHEYPAAETASSSVAEQVAAIFHRLDAAEACGGGRGADAGASGVAGLGRGAGSAGCGGESEGGECSDEEEDLPVSRLLSVHPSAAALQCALYLNSARCSLLSGAWAAALARAARVERIAAGVTGAQGDQCAVYRRTALVLSARAALGASRFRLALRHASALLDAPCPHGETGAADARREVRGLVTEIERKRAALVRSNKRLARDVSAWVEEAMHAGEASGAARGLHTTADDE